MESQGQMVRTQSNHRIKKQLQKPQPKQVPIMVQQSENQNQFDPHILQKFKHFLNRNRNKRLREKLAYFYGRNYPIQYESKFNFTQKWETQEKSEDKTTKQLISVNSHFIQSIMLIILLSNWFIMWSLTVQRIIKKQKAQSLLQSLTSFIGFFSRFCSLGLKYFLQAYRIKNISLKILMSLFLPEIICLGYFVVALITSKINDIYFLPLQVAIFIYLYSYSREYFKILRLSQSALKYEHHFKIIDLMINLFTIAHLIALVLYAVTWCDYPVNWTSSIHNFQQEDYLTQYLYSFYFCSTTILTVGYGDLAPKNKPQVIVTILMQFFGVVFFGYMVNQIGHTLSIMRTEEQNLQRDLNHLKKIQNFYNIKKTISNKAKQHLIANRSVGTYINPQDQNNLLSKLNQELRSTIIIQKALSVVKSSIFFLCRWSKQLQKLVALELQQGLFAPNQRLLQPPTKQRIYIIKKGKIELFMNRFGDRGQHRRRVRTIQINDQSPEIGNNIYGYIGVIGSKINRLAAICSCFTSSYYIDKDSFMKCVNNNNADREYYHQIKIRIDQADFPQSFEAPSILNIREHYYPSKMNAVRKQNAACNRTSNKRKLFARYRRAKMRSIDLRTTGKLRQDINDKVICISTQNNIEEGTRSPTQLYEQPSDRALTINHAAQRQTIVSIRQNTTIQTSIGSLPKLQEDKIFQATFFKEQLGHYFEKQMEFTNFFPHNNLTVVLRQMQRQNSNQKHQDHQILKINNILCNQIYNQKSQNVIYQALRA